MYMNIGYIIYVYTCNCKHCIHYVHVHIYWIYMYMYMYILCTCTCIALVGRIGRHGDSEEYDTEDEIERCVFVITC